MGVLGQLLGLTDTPSPDLASLNTLFQRNLNDQIGQLNASTPGRFSSANLYQQGQLRQRSLQDFNVLASQIQQQGRSQQLQAIMALLGPALGPTFGGPFTQGASPWENILGGINAVANVVHGGGGGNTSVGPTGSLGRETLGPQTGSYPSIWPHIPGM